MLRLCYIIIVSLPFILLYLLKASYIEHHDDRYTEADRYKIAKQAVSIMQHNGFIHTDIYGKENIVAIIDRNKSLRGQKQYLNIPIITFEESIGASCLIKPPWIPYAGFALVALVIMLTPSTTT